jgi:hypothetical protein
VASLIGGAAVAVAGGGYAVYGYERQQAWVPFVHAVVGPEACGDSDAGLQMAYPSIQLDAYRRTCHFHTRIFAGYAIAGVGLAAAVVSLIMLTRDPVASDGHADAVRAASRVAIAPLVAPDLAGAQIALAW